MVETPALRPTSDRAGNPFTLPNLLTYGRILAVPAIIVTYYLQDDLGRWLSLAIFVAASVTDFFDGYLARMWKQQSSIGRMLDPIADKLLVATSLMLLVSDNTIGGWSLLAAIVILTREISVSGLREFLAELRVSVPVTRLAKWKTTLQMVAIGFLLAGSAGDNLFPNLDILGSGLGIVSYIGLLLLWISALVTLYTGYDYFRAGIRHLLSEDS
ncbi:MAG: CDP-diacylglycerol--glycerol-3-phosphate 3-phosphatidyltransferase [Bauldia sp.]|uniref:CDP-diacylglycerol--glycerol-3-phosphate 3-phosphatidyltransferase n=1 Tax=Bauldia sp. TaxID=2575872 RepID=UPI001D279A75|nr:CDP-diacylglycerol--glycerol-3-phosphate 3-phosphatidyltransferase [Bauldia sp.]MCB1488766.1 CDP-diacylglycerol--glycerol-3-phosphate 3-phosphatidyltransferase [Bauldia sp.]MCB1495921.1 CDP-diacylglycerol--glycerol-3-phosphate 3-phosphatidyltransferase [Bauldia sp.]